MKTNSILLSLLSLFPLCFSLQASASSPRFIQIEATQKETRSLAVDLGLNIEFVHSDSAWGFISEKKIPLLKEKGIRVLGDFDFLEAQDPHQPSQSTSSNPSSLRFPKKDNAYHDYEQTRTALYQLETNHPELAKVHVIGKTPYKAEILALQINSEPSSLKKGSSNKPGIIFMGNHHAREHLSAEVPLMLAQYLLANKNTSPIQSLLTERDIWIIPIVNPEGKEYDTTDSEYQMWRKNRRYNGDGTYGVDLNRNYGYHWGEGGASADTDDETYRGKAPFSERETQIIKSFVESHLNATILLSFHSYSELILYPWGYTYKKIDRLDDFNVFETMARTMAQWNLYKPQQSSKLYIASGDTTDWAYGEHGIFSFTFELSPKSSWGGGFYPGNKAIPKAFQDNLKPCLYLIEAANDPYQVLNSEKNNRIKNKFEIHPLHF